MYPFTGLQGLPITFSIQQRQSAICLNTDTKASLIDTSLAQISKTSSLYSTNINKGFPNNA